ncbi:MAG: hypothetical protein CFK52_09680 [Chloracidobacterium sp. CP2_5A]|nr:MAG: hypothetical protein CFK52_09680 [Chloracidobacterium sp. CP2_5A]
MGAPRPRRGQGRASRTQRGNKAIKQASSAPPQAKFRHRWLHGTIRKVILPPVMMPDTVDTILVVEDDAVQRQLLEAFLKQQGYRARSAATLAEATASLAEGLPEAFILDAMLPDGSGLDICRQIRALPGGATRPILMVTAYDAAPIIAEAFAAGVADFIAKPVSLQLLGRRLQRLIQAARSEATLQAQVHQYAALMDALPDLVICGSYDGRVTYFKSSETCPAEMFELAITPGARLTDILPPESASALMRAIHQLKVESRPIAEYRARCQGQWREFEARVIPRDAASFVAIIRDVTERKAAERLREDFTAMVAHDIRSPLTGMQMALDLFERRNAGADQDWQAAIDVARQGLEKVARLAGDLLELFRSNQAGMTLLKGVVFPSALARRCVGEVALQAQDKRIALDIDLPDDLPPFVGDGPKLERAFSNLLSNAIKFTPPGGRVTVSGAADGDWIVMSVADTGHGIAPEFQAAMFDPYRQAGPGDSSGFGLGLAIVKRIVTAHGGRISVESAVGQGTVFTVRLPMQAS